MENRKGSGIFLGVVGVATLVVAIIGATFAYFSASVTAKNTVDLTAYEFNAEINLTPVVAPTNAKIVPLLPEATLADGVSQTYDKNLLYAMNEGNCVDSKGYQVCAVYEISVKNNGSAAITLNGTLTTTKNAHPNKDSGNTNKFVNLKYVSLDQEEALAGTYSYGDTLTAETLPDVDGMLTLNGMTVQPGQTAKEYFVVYLNDTNETLDEENTTNSQNSEMGAVYQGQITYADQTSGSKLTGTFTVGA